MSILSLIMFFIRGKLSVKFFRNYKNLFLVLLAMFVSWSATPQVTADFITLTSTTGCGSLVVEFKDLSAGNPISWLWDFGNGNTSTLKDPIAIYNVPGIYDVSLKVSDLNTNDIKIHYTLIKIYEEPIAEFQANSSVVGCAPLVASFQDISILNPTISSWQWDFGDGGSSNLQNPDHIYINDGNYSVSLSVIDVNGCQSLVTITDLVDVNVVPVADFAADITFSCNSSELVSFSNNSIDASIFSWDFGDGSTSSVLNPSHSFSSGIFSVILYAFQGSCADTLIMNNLIQVVDSLSPDFVVNTNSGCEGLNVSFLDLTNSNPNTFLWDFGDGATSVLQNPIHVFDTAGVYDIELTVSMSGQCVTTHVFPEEIKIFDAPIVSFIADTTLACSLPSEITFFDNTIDAVAWYWNFGDGNVSNDQNPSNIYTNSGMFDVSLLVENVHGCTSSVTFLNYIEINKSPIVDFNATPVVSCVNQDVIFFDFSSIGSNNWQWDFGDGSFSNDQNPIYQYSLTGVYDVSLIAGQNSCKDTLVISDYIKIVEPTAMFEEVYNCVNPFIVEFIDLSVGADDMLWDFGDGNTSTLSNPTHTFLNLGLYTVSLSVNNILTGCSDIFIKQIEITDPIANFDYLINVNNSYEDSVGCVPKRVYLNNTSQDWFFYEVLWSDGYVGYSRTDHLFTDTGTFDVTMIITDVHGCKDTSVIKDMFHMHDVSVDFGVSNITGCDSMLVEFQDLSSHPFSSVFWDFGDGAISVANNPHHIYYNEGYYDVSLYTKSIHGCKDTLKRLEYVKFQPPVANFISSNHYLCKDDQVQFTNLSHGLGINSFWDFGDGILSNDTHPAHSFLTNGMYDINLLVTDSFGCSDNLTLADHIKVLSPEADFSTVGLGSNCPPLIANFMSLSSPDASLFKWNFGDNTTSLIEDPSHLFVNAGLFDVSLIVENDFGCQDTLVQNSYIDLSGLIPMGSFVSSDTLICKGGSISFVPTVVNVNSFLWDFGNGFFSTDSLANHVYSDPGIFTPNLVVDNGSGCQLTINTGDTIFVNEVFVDAGVNTEVCEGDFVQLHANGNGSFFSWSPANTLSSALIENPTASPDSSVLYFVTHTDGLCSAVDSVLINVHNDVPQASFVTNNHCEGDTTFFIASSGLTTSNNSYLWSFGENGKLVNSVLNMGSNTITLILENLNNSCKDTVSKEILISKNPDVNFLIKDSKICLGESVDLIDFSFIDTVQWIYDFGDGLGVSFEQNPSYTYMSAGIYDITLTIVSDIGCSSELIKEVMIYDLPTPKFKVDSNLCLGDALAVSYVADNNANIVAWNYNFGDGHSSSAKNPIYEYSYSGAFNISLDVISSEGCKNFPTAPTVVRVNSLPIIDFKANKLIASEMFSEISFYNLSEGAISYEWDFDNGDYSFEENPIYSFSSPDIYNVTLTVIDDFGCSAEMVKAVQINPEHKFFIPDSFTPDGDGLNDFFLAKAHSLISYKMQVFDRWGGVVFESDDIDFGWNGKNLLGIRLDKGVYLYHVELYDENGKLWVYNGELNLLR